MTWWWWGAVLAAWRGHAQGRGRLGSGAGRENRLGAFSTSAHDGFGLVRYRGGPHRAGVASGPGGGPVLPGTDLMTG